MKEKVGVIYSVFEDDKVIETIERVWTELSKNNSTDFYSQIFENEEVEKAILEALEKTNSK